MVARRAAIKETLFRYMRRAAIRLQSSLLMAMHGMPVQMPLHRLLSRLVLPGRWAGYPGFDPAAAFVVGLLILRMGYSFAADAMHDSDGPRGWIPTRNMHQSASVNAGVAGLHDLKTRKVGEILSSSMHLEVPEHLSVRDGYDIAVAARERGFTPKHGVFGMSWFILIHVPVANVTSRGVDAGSLRSAPRTHFREACGAGSGVSESAAQKSCQRR